MAAAFWSILKSVLHLLLRPTQLSALSYLLKPAAVSFLDSKPHDEASVPGQQGCLEGSSLMPCAKATDTPNNPLHTNQSAPVNCPVVMSAHAAALHQHEEVYAAAHNR